MSIFVLKTELATVTDPITIILGVNLLIMLPSKISNSEIYFENAIDLSYN